VSVARLSVRVRQTAARPDCVRRAQHARQKRRGSAECVIQRRFAIRVDSVPSCKLGSARTRPRVITPIRQILFD